MSSWGGAARRNDPQTTLYLRQANILRKNLYDWHFVLRDARGEDWPKMCGRLNTALNQVGCLDDCIDDVLEHFVYVPKKPVMNLQDIPEFLSSRVEVGNSSSYEGEDSETVSRDLQSIEETSRPDIVLQRYETQARRLVLKLDQNRVRF
jgi:hypothetical protein